MSKRDNRLVLAGAAGNVLEWYDFAVYGYFAAVVGQHFFPSDDPAVSLIASFGAFAAGFLMRPIGSVIFGHIGDRYGHKAALTASVVLMAVPTFLLGVLPTYESIGIAAPVLLVLLRMAQGASVGGEYTTSIAFLAEGSHPSKRGLTASWSSCGAVLGVLLGSGTAALISTLLDPEQLVHWGWRVPFLLGVLIAVAGVYLRRHMQPSITSRPDGDLPLITSVRDYWREMLRIVGLALSVAVSFYLVFVYVASWLQEVVHVSKARALDINTFCMALMVLLIPVTAVLSDRVGRKPVLIGCFTGLTLFSFPLFWMMHHPNDWLILTGQLGFAILIGAAGGVFPAMLAELAPAAVRVTVMSVGYNLTLGLFGGTAPMVAAYLVHSTEVDLSPAFYLSAVSLVSLLVAIGLPETAGASLRMGNGAEAKRAAPDG